MQDAKQAVSDAETLARHIRLDSLEMAFSMGGGHIGPSFSCAEILAVLYSGVLNIRPDEPEWPDRDRLLLSKGHAVTALYSCLFHRGFISRELMMSFEKKNSLLPGHPPAHGVAGIDFPTGSMGHGMGVGSGMALGLKHSGSSSRVYVVVGDGELNEGTNWEAAMFAAKYKLNNMTVIADKNGLQHDADAAFVMPFDIAAAFSAFGWEVVHTDGHDCDALFALLSAPREGERPLAIVADTVKGKGVSFIEGNNLWHYHKLDDALYEAALAELKEVR